MLATEPLTSSLYSGFTGIAWAVELVDRLLGAEGEDRNGDIDDALTSLLRRYPEDAPYDLVNGLTGLGVYALARWPRPGAAPCVLGVVEQLARRARHDRDGVYWWTPPSWRGPRREQYRPGGVDLGVAHGIAGVIPFLARVHRLGLARPTVRPLLDGAVRWLLAHLVDTASGPTVPYFVADGVEPGPARSAWCYGDPGVAAALLLAARDVGEPAWAAGGDRPRGAGRRPPARPDRRHGRRAVPRVGRPGAPVQPDVPDDRGAGPRRRGAVLGGADSRAVLRDGSRAGARQATDAARPACNGPGLLEGAAGVALAMEAAATTAEPVWDQMLLVSTAGTPGSQAR